MDWKHTHTKKTKN